MVSKIDLNSSSFEKECLKFHVKVYEQAEPEERNFTLNVVSGSNDTEKTENHIEVTIPKEAFERAQNQKGKILI